MKFHFKPRWHTATRAAILAVGLAGSGAARCDSTSVLPLSDPANTGGWVLNEQVSDEFNGRTLDEDKWYIVGKFENGKPVYKDPDHPNRTPTARSGLAARPISFPAGTIAWKTES